MTKGLYVFSILLSVEQTLWQPRSCPFMLMTKPSNVPSGVRVVLVNGRFELDNQLGDWVVVPSRMIEPCRSRLHSDSPCLLCQSEYSGIAEIPPTADAYNAGNLRISLSVDG